jgi:hypothetical protein
MPGTASRDKAERLAPFGATVHDRCRRCGEGRGGRGLHAGERSGDRGRAVPPGRGRRHARRHALHRHGLHPAARSAGPCGPPDRARSCTSWMHRSPAARWARRTARWRSWWAARQRTSSAPSRSFAVLGRATHVGPQRRRRTRQAGQSDDRRHHHRGCRRSAAAVRQRWRRHGEGAGGHHRRFRRQPHSAAPRPAHGGARTSRRAPGLPCS